MEAVAMTISTTNPGLSAALASPFTPIAVINGTPVYPFRGGRTGGGIQFAVGDDEGDDPEFDDEDDSDEDDEDDEDDEPPAATAKKRQRPGRNAPAEDEDDGTDWQPPSREAFQRMEAALQKANKDAARHRRAGKAMDRLGITDLPTYLTERGIDPDTGLPYGNDVVDPDDDGDDGRDERDDRGQLFGETPARRERDRLSDKDLVRQVRTAEQRGRKAAMDQLTPILAQQAAENAMRLAGFDGDTDELELALRMIDTRQVDVEVDADGYDIVGIDEQVEAIKQRMPRLFKQDEKPTRTRAGERGAPVRKRTGAAAVDGGERGRRAAKPQTWAEQMAQQLNERR